MSRTEMALRGDDDSVSRQAAGWVARLRSEDCSSADWERFRVWRGASDKNGAAFDSAMESWDALDMFAQDPEILQMRIDAMSIDKEVSVWHVSLMPIAASFLMVVAVGLLVLLSPNLFDGSADRDVAMAASANTGLPSSAADITSSGSAADSMNGFAQVFSSAIGQRSSVDLPDGSSVELNTDTIIEIDFSANRRHLRLVRGEAVFDVAHDADRPFVVLSGDGQVTALGTIFSVRRIGGEMVVALIEGSVEVERMAEGPGGERLANVRLSPGQQARSLASVAEFEVTRVNVNRALSWRTGRLMFDDDRLDQVVAEVNRYSVRKLVLADPALADLRLSGAFRAGSPEKFADALTVALPVTVEPLRESGDLVISASPAKSTSR